MKWHLNGEMDGKWVEKRGKRTQGKEQNKKVRGVSRMNFFFGIHFENFGKVF